MRNRFGKVALATGSAVLAAALLVVAYVAAGAFILAGFLSAVFLIGERTDVVQYVFAPIAVAAALVFAAAAWALATLGAGAFWMWKKRADDDNSVR
jgi:formate hydrogenlyase subunit 3/multisubunit Na+/H+ antiporter MnhD subunit